MNRLILLFCLLFFCNNILAKIHITGEKIRSDINKSRKYFEKYPFLRKKPNYSNWQNTDSLNNLVYALNDFDRVVENKENKSVIIAIDSLYQRITDPQLKNLIGHKAKTFLIEILLLKAMYYQDHLPTKAVQYCQQAIDACASINHLTFNEETKHLKDNLLAKSYQYLSEVYFFDKKPEESERYLDLAYILFKKTGRTISLRKLEIDRIRYYMESSNLPKAIKYLESLRPIADNLITQGSRKPFYPFEVYDKLIMLYELVGNWPKQQELVNFIEPFIENHYKEKLEHFQIHKQKMLTHRNNDTSYHPPRKSSLLDPLQIISYSDEKAYDLMKILDEAVKNKDFKKGIKAGESAVKSIDSNTRPSLELRIYENLRNCYEQIGDKDNTIKYYRIYSDFLRKEYKSDYLQRIHDVGTKTHDKHQEERIAAEKKLAEEQKKLAQEQERLAREQENQKLFFIFVSLIVLFFAYKYYIQNKQSIKDKNQINKLKETLDHSVKNNFFSLYASIDETIDKHPDSSNIGALTTISNRILSMTEMIDLVHGNFEHQKPLKLQDFITDAISIYSSNNGYENVKIKNMSPKQFNPSITTKFAQKLSITIEEIVTNSCKHAFSGTKPSLIQFSVVKQEGNLILRIQDNGMGSSKFQSILNLKKKSSRGISIIEDNIVNNLEGGIELIANRNKGLGFVITIPYKKINLGKNPTSLD